VDGCVQGINVSPTSVIVTFAPSLVFVVTDVVVSAITYRVHVSHVHYYNNNNNCVSTLPRRTSHHTALKMICNGFLVVKVNCWSYVFNIVKYM